MAKKRTSKMSRGVGGIAVFALALGLYFGRGFGLGQGDGNGAGPNSSGTAGGQQSSVQEANQDGSASGDAALASVAPTETAASDTSDEPTPPQVGDVLTILIDGREFYVPEFGDQPIEHEQLVKFALETTGDESGVRVKVVRRKTARVSAKADLAKLLREGGMPDESVYWQKQYVE